MPRQFLSLALFLLAATVGSGQDMVIIEGNVTGDPKGHDKIYLYGNGPGIKQDSTHLVDGKFRFTFPYEEGCMRVIYSEYELKVKGGYEPLPAVIDHAARLYLRDADITKGLNSGTWEGDTAAAGYQSFDKKMKVVNDNVLKQLKQRFPDPANAGTSIPKHATPSCTLFIPVR